MNDPVTVEAENIKPKDMLENPNTVKKGKMAAQKLTATSKQVKEAEEPLNNGWGQFKNRETFVEMHLC